MPNIPFEWPAQVLERQHAERTGSHVILTTIEANMLENEEKWKAVKIMAQTIMGKYCKSHMEYL